MDALRQVDSWGAGRAAAGVVRADGVVATHGRVDEPYRWASITKPVTTLAPLRVRGLEKVALHADLTILARTAADVTREAA